MTTNVERWLREDGKTFLEDIGIKRGQIVLDFGCGVGHYTIPASKVVSEEGKVYALDKDREVINQLMEKAELEGLKNIVPLYSQSKISLKDEYVDLILIYDVLHYNNLMERNKIYDESYRVLKNGGLLSVYPKHCKLDEPLWNLSDTELEDIIKEIEGAKFNFEGKFYKKLIHNNGYNMGYVLNFTKNKKEGVPL